MSDFSSLERERAAPYLRLLHVCESGILSKTMKKVHWALKQVGLGKVPISYSKKGDKTIIKIEVWEWAIWTYMILIARWSLEQLGLQIEMTKEENKTLLQFETDKELFCDCQMERSHDKCHTLQKENSDDTIQEYFESDDTIQEYSHDTMQEFIEATWIEEELFRGEFEADLGSIVDISNEDLVSDFMKATAEEEKFLCSRDLARRSFHVPKSKINQRQRSSSPSLRERTKIQLSNLSFRFGRKDLVPSRIIF